MIPRTPLVATGVEALTPAKAGDITRLWLMA